MTIKPPNYTQIPNELLDKMADMSPAEFKVLMAICRKTFGWQKSHDVISLTQLERMTGLSRSAVHQAITAGIERGMLEQTKVTKQTFSYRLLVASDYQSTQTTSNGNGSEPVVSGYQLVASDYQSPEPTSSLSGPVPVASGYLQLVASDYTQKKELTELKKLKENGGSARARDATPTLFLVPDADLADEERAVSETPRGVPEAVAIWEQVFAGRKMPPAQVAAIVPVISDFQHWREVCQQWRDQGYRPLNISGLVDNYRKRDEPPRSVSPFRPSRGYGPQSICLMGEPLDETESEIRIRTAARKAELMKDMPVGL